jgi:hypothetical protein
MCLPVRSNFPTVYPHRYTGKLRGYLRVRSLLRATSGFCHGYLADLCWKCFSPTYIYIPPYATKGFFSAPFKCSRAVFCRIIHTFVPSTRSRPPACITAASKAAERERKGRNALSTPAAPSPSPPVRAPYYGPFPAATC